MLNSQLAALALCTTVAVSTLLPKESLWHLGSIYWLVLELLALVHVIVSGAVFVVNPGRLLVRLYMVVVLIVGQWWVIQMIVMQVIWRLRGFAP